MIQLIQLILSTFLFISISTVRILIKLLTTVFAQLPFFEVFFRDFHFPLQEENWCRTKLNSNGQLRIFSFRKSHSRHVCSKLQNNEQIAEPICLLANNSKIISLNGLRAQPSSNMVSRKVEIELHYQDPKRSTVLTKNFTRRVTKTCPWQVQ